MSEVRKFETKGALQLLLFLAEKGKVKITQIDFHGSKSTMYHALGTLAELELIDEERKPPFTRYIQLTGDGEAIAKKLQEINQILKAKKDRSKRQART